MNLKSVLVYQPKKILAQIEALKEMYEIMQPYDWEYKVRRLDLHFGMSALMDIPGTAEARLRAQLTKTLED